MTEQRTSPSAGLAPVGGAGPMPLAAHPALHTDDLEYARHRIESVFCRHELTFLGRDRPGPVRFNAVELDEVGLSYLDYGSAVRVAAEAFDTFVVVQIPLHGRAQLRMTGEVVDLGPTTAAVPDPDHRGVLETEAGTDLLIVRFDRAALHLRACRLFGLEADQHCTLPQALDLTSPGGQAWLQAVDLLRADVEHGGVTGGPGCPGHPVLGRRLQQLVTSQLLLAHARPPATRAVPAAPRRIRQAAELIADRAHEALTVEDVAEAVGLSVRSLQEGFRRHLDTTPTERLRAVRLDGVHSALVAADPSRASVSTVASDWGFGHLGRFSAAYRRRYGRSPSETLRG